MENSICLSFLSLILVLCLTFNYFYGSRVDPREPPLVISKFPLFGHLIGLLRHGSSYFEKISAKNSLPIYTLEIFSTRFYVINSLPLLSAVHRNSKTISFAPFVKIAAESLAGLGPDATMKFDQHEQRMGLSVETIKDIAHVLHPGPDAAELISSMLTHLGDLMDRPQLSQPRPCHLMKWMKHIITQASTRAIYGPLSPLLDEGVADAFWTFELNATPLLFNFAPGLIASKAVKAREKVAQRFFEYYQSRGQDQGSALARARHDSPMKYSLTEEDTAHLEVPFLIAVLANAVPTIFWMLCHIFSRSDLLAELRIELSKAVKSELGESKSNTGHIIEIAILKQKCPLLLSIYHEILRTCAILPGTRQVLEDTMLDDHYLLKKGSIIQMPVRFAHFDTTLWGADAEEMDLRRFVRKDQRRYQGLAFRTFGGAPNICPGRHFATTEILALITLVVMKYDILPANGRWAIPKKDQSVFAAIPPPLNDLEITIQERQGWEGVWSFDPGDPNLKFALASG